jgi:copper chaperone CopZ
VTKTVQAVDADAKLEIDLPTQRVRVESQHDRQEFVKALSDEGYAPAA